MPHRIQMVGRRFGRLVVVADTDESGNLLGTPGYRLVDVVCDCGTKKRVAGRGLRKSHTTSCGCAHRDAASTHGVSSHPLYPVWSSMIGRCYREASQSFRWYGARGIRVCEQWRDSPESFISWAVSNGWRPGLQIDRIDNDGDYSPLNCRFVTSQKNGNNKSNNSKILVYGELLTLSEASRKYRLPYDVLIQRIRKLGWDAERAVSQPVRDAKRREAA